MDTVYNLVLIKWGYKTWHHLTYYYPIILIEGPHTAALHRDVCVLGAGLLVGGLIGHFATKSNMESASNSAQTGGSSATTVPTTKKQSNPTTNPTTEPAPNNTDASNRQFLFDNVMPEEIQKTAR